MRRSGSQYPLAQCCRADTDGRPCTDGTTHADGDTRVVVWPYGSIQRGTTHAGGNTRVAEWPYGSIHVAPRTPAAIRAWPNGPMGPYTDGTTHAGGDTRVVEWPYGSIHRWHHARRRRYARG